jgi:hypothetical protein
MKLDAYFILLNILAFNRQVLLPVGVLSTYPPLEARLGVGKDVDLNDTLLTLKESKLLDASSKLVDWLWFD